MKKHVCMLLSAFVVSFCMIGCSQFSSVKSIPEVPGRASPPVNMDVSPEKPVKPVKFVRASYQTPCTAKCANPVQFSYNNMTHDITFSAGQIVCTNQSFDTCDDWSVRGSIFSGNCTVLQGNLLCTNLIHIGCNQSNGRIDWNLAALGLTTGVTYTVSAEVRHCAGCFGCSPSCSVFCITFVY